MGYLILLLSQVMIGFVGAAARYAGSSAEWITVGRCGTAACALAIALIVTGSGSISKVKEHFWPLLTTGGLMGLNWFLFFNATLTADLTIAILTYNATPLFSAASAALFLGEVALKGQRIALGLVAAAVTSTLVYAAANGQIVGALYALAASAFYAQVSVVGRQLNQLPAVLITVCQCLVGGLFVLPFAIASGVAPPISVQGIAAVLVIGIGMTALPYMLYFRALQKLPALTVSLAHCIYTLTTFSVGIFWFNENLSPWLFTSLTLVCVAPFIDLVIKAFLFWQAKAHTTSTDT